MRVIKSAILAGMLVSGCATNNTGDEIFDDAATGVDAINMTSATDAGPYGAYVPPEPGTLVTLQSVYKDEDDSELKQLVVASGDDYAIFANVLDSGLSGPEDLFIEYSGVYWHDCSRPDLTNYQRDKLKALWPLEVGDSVQVPFDGDPTQLLTVEVVEWKDVEIDGVGTFKSAVIRNAYETVDYSSFSPEMGMSLRIDWGEPGEASHAGFDVVTSIDDVELANYQDYVDLALTACLPE